MTSKTIGKNLFTIQESINFTAKKNSNRKTLFLALTVVLLLSCVSSITMEIPSTISVLWCTGMYVVMWLFGLFISYNVADEELLFISDRVVNIYKNTNASECDEEIALQILEKTLEHNKHRAVGYQLVEGTEVASRRSFPKSIKIQIDNNEGSSYAFVYTLGILMAGIVIGAIMFKVSQPAAIAVGIIGITAFLFSNYQRVARVMALYQSVDETDEKKKEIQLKELRMKMLFFPEHIKL